MRKNYIIALNFEGTHEDKLKLRGKTLMSKKIGCLKYEIDEKVDKIHKARFVFAVRARTFEQALQKLSTKMKNTQHITYIDYKYLGCKNV